MDLHTTFNRARMDDRQVNELIGIAHGLTADGNIDQNEAEYLQKWLTVNSRLTQNPIITTLMVRVNDILADKKLDSEEAVDLLHTLKALIGGDFELGELLKSTTLPLDTPAPNIHFQGGHFCFTGTFAFGSRRECETATKNLGATTSNLTLKTQYLIVGIYATDSWIHSSYGRKIEKARDMQKKQHPIAIISEEHWLSYLE